MKSKILFSALFITFLGIANISMAANDGFSGNHPRRAEVNQRLRNQHHRIHYKMNHGDISRRQAHRLHHQDHRSVQQGGDVGDKLQVKLVSADPRRGYLDFVR
jgi:hypothetical protein